MNRFFLAVLTCFSLALPVFADDGGGGAGKIQGDGGGSGDGAGDGGGGDGGGGGGGISHAQHIASAKASSTLKAWGKKERTRLTSQNIGYRMSGPKDLCEIMRSVGLGCSYNERGELVQFLYVNGTNLFPCRGGSNPYTKDFCEKENVDFYNYIGRPVQNSMLKKSIGKNLDLFKNGNLTAGAARKWKR